MIHRWWATAAGLILVFQAVAAPPVVVGAEVGPLVARIKAVGREGAGNDQAARAWKKLVQCGPRALPEVLAGMDGASAIAANWLRAAVDAIAEHEIMAGHSLPAAPLETFVRQTQHSGPARRLAYEWLVRADPKAPGRLLPGMLQDPSPELRRDAVEVVLQQAQALQDKGNKAGAEAAYRQAFADALDQDQVELGAKQLKTLGVQVDLPAHFGFIQSWWLIGPFDSTGGTGFAKVFPPERRIDLSAHYQGKNGARLNWVQYTTSDPYGMVDLNKALGKHMGAAAYALAVVVAAGERPVQIRTGSNNAVKIFLNGKLLFSREEYHHGMRMDQHVGQGTLRAGRNEILIKVCQNEQQDSWAQNWSFQARVCDTVGAAVPVTVAGKTHDSRRTEGKAQP